MRATEQAKRCQEMYELESGMKQLGRPSPKVSTYVEPVRHDAVDDSARMGFASRVHKRSRTQRLLLNAQQSGHYVLVELGLRSERRPTPRPAALPAGNYGAQ